MHSRSSTNLIWQTTCIPPKSWCSESVVPLSLGLGLGHFMAKNRCVCTMVQVDSLTKGWFASCTVQAVLSLMIAILAHSSSLGDRRWLEDAELNANR